jgi:peptide methionine sulfoxide reductase MsrA
VTSIEARSSRTPRSSRRAEASRERAQARFERPIATQIQPLTVLYPAEYYHQADYERNGHHPYCHVVPTRTRENLGLIAARG